MSGLGKTLIYALLLGLLCFMAVGRKRGFSLSVLLKMAWDGGKTSFPVLRVLILIGCLTALWRASGTITFFVYYGIKLITPHLFVLIAFILTAVLSFGIGTSFGVAGTAGVVLMILARSGGVNEIITAGAVMSGSYFGERCSPASSSALLAVSLSGADGVKNLKVMLKTSLLPTVLTAAVYGVLSWKNPILSVDSSILTQMSEEFSLTWAVLLPAAGLLCLALAGVRVFYAVAASGVIAFLTAVVIQKQQVWDVAVWAVTGYRSGSEELAAILSGGGMTSMAGVLVIVIISSAYSGIFKSTGMLDGIQEKAAALAGKMGRFAAQIVTGICSGGLFCNQTIGIIMAEQMLGSLYEDPQEQAADVCNSIVMIAGLIPWSIAATGPLAMLEVGTEAIPYSILLYMVPLTYLMTKKVWYR
ncbi:Na+/H+ antiporter NhaC family protein [Clostridium sp. AM58-1XD]|uniref:Na+/H+ antiporter NhaC family protein n=1 Tax=Clostridium sp. AM58-1XD TaxID=2292307 RepID=UPI000E47319F|nr:Na+/H+ antiporter NhaC family protein [Clostridium sp. AM58-1XD]RGY96201.1 Na+/H+ antiporter NhaC family protein [Clostridium sp. AM58-1XD]